MKTEHRDIIVLLPCCKSINKYRFPAGHMSISHLAMKYVFLSISIFIYDYLNPLSFIQENCDLLISLYSLSFDSAKKLLT